MCVTTDFQFKKSWSLSVKTIKSPKRVLFYNEYDLKSNPQDYLFVCFGYVSSFTVCFVLGDNHVQLYMYKLQRTHVQAYTKMCTHTSKHVLAYMFRSGIHDHVHAYMCMNTRVCMYVCMRERVCVTLVCVYTYTYVCTCKCMTLTPAHN